MSPPDVASTPSAHMSPADLRSRLVDIARKDLPALVRELVIDRQQPHCFADDLTVFPMVQEHLASGLKIDPGGVRLVGSGCVGYSVAPDTFPRQFHDGSDLDFAIVSEELFDAAWDTLLTWGHPRRHGLYAHELDWFNRRKDEIFWGWIDVGYLTFPRLKFMRELRPLRDLRFRWFDAFQSVSGAFPSTHLAGRDVGGRLYRTEDQLVHYQAEGLRKLKYRLANASKKKEA
ncbi:hypothetical protein DJ010_12655 [Nocardioides silvaticus]|uniref:Uncharacterized protein n=1 Tax=Nocardioides silvaticus TaxID=2201891 RepID=A0A316TDN5_9ACTN|nr:hypothetical protein [Nocardioides silvaticus]PWN02563.1 hypothetical protein DJ010_12655 [Nocardioides silvaticus]